MTINPVWTVHRAGYPVDMIQRCVLCGFVLTDNTAWAEGRVAYMLDDPNPGPSWWQAGALVGTDQVAGDRGGCTFQVGPEGRELEPDERMCT